MDVLAHSSGPFRLTQQSNIHVYALREELREKPQHDSADPDTTWASLIKKTDKHEVKVND